MLSYAELIAAIEKGDLKTVEEYSSHLDEVLNEEGEKAIHIAAKADQLGIFKYVVGEVVKLTKYSRILMLPEGGKIPNKDEVRITVYLVPIRWNGRNDEWVGAYWYEDKKEHKKALNLEKLKQISPIFSHFIKNSEELLEINKKDDPRLVNDITSLCGINRSFINILIEPIKNEKLDSFKMTPLHISAKYGALKVFHYLLDNDAFVNKKTKQKITPLHYAAYYK
jgi:hypothetical protein